MTSTEPFSLSPYEPPRCSCGRVIRTRHSKAARCLVCARQEGGKQRKGHTRQGVSKRSDGKTRSSPAVEYDCEGHEGECGHVGCPMNLSLDVSDAGTITVYGTPTMPTRRVRAVELDAFAEQAQAELLNATVEARQAWMVSEWGSICARWIARQGRLSQVQIASIFRVTRQATEQEEARALKDIKRPAERLYQIRKRPRAA